MAANILEEAIESVKSSYNEFIDGLDNQPHKLGDLLDPKEMTSAVMLAQLKIPRAISLSKSQAESSLERHKRLTAGLNNMISILNARVQSDEESILDTHPDLLKYYEVADIIFSISSLISRGHQMYVNHSQILKDLDKVETKLGQLSIPADLDLAYQLSMTESSFRNKGNFKQLFENFRGNLVSHTEQRTELREKATSGYQGLRNVKVPDVSDQFALSLKDTFLEFSAVLQNILAEKYSAEFSAPARADTNLAARLVAIFTKLRDYKLSDLSSSVSSVDLTGGKNQGLMTEIMLESQVSKCQGYIKSRQDWIAQQSMLASTANYLLSADYHELIVTGNHLSSRGTAYLTRVHGHLDKCIQTHGSSTLFDKLSQLCDSLDTLNQEIEVLGKIEEEKIKAQRAVRSDRLKAIAVNSKASFAPLFSPENELFHKWYQSWKRFSEDVNDKKLLYLYLKDAVSSNKDAALILEATQDYDVALAEVWRTFARTSELASIIQKRIYALPAQAQSVTDEQRILREMKSLFFSLENNGMLSVMSKSLVRFCNSRLLERHYLKINDIIVEEKLESATDLAFYEKFLLFVNELRL